MTAGFSLFSRYTLRNGLALSLSLLMASGSVLPLMAETLRGGDQTDFYLLKAKGKPIGHVAIRTFTDASGQVTEIENVNRFKREGTDFNLSSKSRFVARPEDGRPVAFTHEYKLPNQEAIQAEGNIRQDADQLRLDVKVINEQQALTGETTLNGQEFLFPGGPKIQEVYKAHFNDSPGSSFDFQTLHLALSPQVVNTRVTVEPAAPAQPELADKPLRKFAVRNPADDSSTVYEWRDAEGKLYLARSLNDGMEMVHASRQQIAMAGRSEQWLDAVSASEIVTNVIPLPRKTYEALYRIEPLIGESVDLTRYFPETRRQKILDEGVPALTSTMRDGLILKVTQKEPPDALVKYPIPYDRQFLQSTPFLQSDDELLERTAKDAVGVEKRAYFAARKLQQWVHNNITTRSMSTGFASARETLISREGDCTEHAVLLAALTRAIGIPSRVAVGFVYLPENSTTTGRFVYHMWTEVYVGNDDRGDWVPLDATNPELMPDATHIKIADSPLASLNDVMKISQTVVGLMGKIKIDVLKALSPAQSVISVAKQPGVLSVDIPKVDLTRFDIRDLSRKAVKYYRVDLPPESLSLDSAEGLFTHGMGLLAKGKYTEANTAFEQMLGKLRKPVAFYRMGERFAAIELYDFAERAFDRAAQGDGNLSTLVDSWKQGYLPERNLTGYTREKFLQGIREEIHEMNNGAAEALFQQVAQDAPDYSPAYLHLGQLALDRGDVDAALSRFKQAAAIRPDDYRAYARMGDAHMVNSNYGAAAASYQKAVEVLKTKGFAYSKPWLEEVSAHHKIAQAAAILDRNERSARGWVELGKGFMLQQRPEDAAKAFNNAMVYQPGLTEAQVYHFQSLLEKSDWKHLQTLYGKIADVSGSNALAARLKGQYEMRTRQYSKAVASLQKAMALAPTRLEPYLLLAETYERIGEQQGYAGKGNETQLNQAIAVLQKGRTRVAPAYDKLPVMAHLARLLIENNRADEGEQVADEMLAIQPVSGLGYSRKGMAQLYQSNLPEAKASLETALLLNPNDVEVLVNLGHVAREEGRDTLAVDYYQKALKIDSVYGPAAVALRTLIDEKQLTAKKPTEYWALTPDERDYLIQILFHNAQNVLYINEVMNQVLPPHKEYGGKIMSLQAAQAKQDIAAVLQAAYPHVLTHYNRLQTMKVPPKFASLHYDVSIYTYDILMLLDWALRYYPSVVGEVQAKAGNEELAALKARGKANSQRLRQKLQAVEKKVSMPVSGEIFYESGMDALLSAALDLPELEGNEEQKKEQASAKAPPPPPKKPEMPTRLQTPD